MNRAICHLPLIVLLTSLAIPFWLLTPNRRTDERSPTQQLQIIIPGPSERTIEAGESLSLTGYLVNVSSQNVTVMKPDSNSDTGWTSPHLSFTASQIIDDKAKQVDLYHVPVGRCGTVGGIHASQFVTLKPGERIPLAFDPHLFVRLSEPGRFTVRYRYRLFLYPSYSQYLMPEFRDPSWLSQEVKRFPEYSIDSQNVHFNVRRSYDLTAKSKRQLKVGETAKLSELMEIRLRNVSDSTLRTNYSPRVWLDFDQSRFPHEITSASLKPEFVERQMEFHLKSGQSESLIGTQAGIVSDDYQIGPFTKPFTLRLRFIAAVAPVDQSSGVITAARFIASEWMELPVVR